MKNEDSNSSAGSPLHGQGQEGYLIQRQTNYNLPPSYTRPPTPPAPHRPTAAEAALIQSIASLVNSMGSAQVAMADLIQSINRFAQSNEMLVQAMAEGEGMDPEDRPITVGLNGRPL